MSILNPSFGFVWTKIFKSGFLKMLFYFANKPPHLKQLHHFSLLLVLLQSGYLSPEELSSALEVKKKNAGLGEHCLRIWHYAQCAC